MQLYKCINVQALTPPPVVEPPPSPSGPPGRPTDPAEPRVTATVYTYTYIV